MTLIFHTASESSGYSQKLMHYSDDGQKGTMIFDGYLYPRGGHTAFIYRPCKNPSHVYGLLKIRILSIETIKDTSYVSVVCEDDDCDVETKVCYTPTQILSATFEVIEDMDTDTGARPDVFYGIDPKTFSLS
jgi:hypothetical protein